MSEGVLLSGTELAAEIRQNLSKELEDIRTNNDSFTPGLVIVQVHCRTPTRVATMIFEDFYTFRPA